MFNWVLNTSRLRTVMILTQNLSENPLFLSQRKWPLEVTWSRGSGSQLFYRIAAMRKFRKFTWKHLQWIDFFSEVAGPDLQIYWKKTWRSCFPANVWKYLRTAFFYRTPLEYCLIVLALFLINQVALELLTCVSF